MSKITLFSALETLVAYLDAKRINENDQPGRAVGEEGGATFGKVTGIEEAIAKHAINVGQLSNLSQKLFQSEIVDDRVLQENLKIDVGSVVTLHSKLYGEERYSLEVDLDNAQRISYQSPMAKAILGGQIGYFFKLGDTEYTILDVQSNNSDETIKRLVMYKENVIKKTEYLLAVSNSNISIGKSEEKLKKKISISNILDTINLIKLVEKVYGFNQQISESLHDLEVKLLVEDHFPIDDLTKKSGFLHIISKVNVEI